MVHVSYILPFYKRAEWLEVVAAHNECFRCDKSEVVLVLDEPTQELDVLRIVHQLKDVRWRVIVNDEDHKWRPPCKAINVGIRHTLGDFVAVLSPETYIILPRPSYIEGLAEHLRGQDVHIGGPLWFLPGGPAIAETPRQALNVVREAEPDLHGYGFLATHKRLFITVGGYDESRTEWGGDDDLIQELLKEVSAQRWDRSIQLAHPHHPSEKRKKGPPWGDIGEVRRTPWELNGWSFSRVAFDWAKKFATASPHDIYEY